MRAADPQPLTGDHDHPVGADDTLGAWSVRGCGRGERSGGAAGSAEGQAAVEIDGVGGSAYLLRRVAEVVSGQLAARAREQGRVLAAEFDRSAVPRDRFLLGVDVSGRVVCANETASSLLR